MTNISSLSCFFNDPAYRPSPQVIDVPKKLHNIVRSDYAYEGEGAKKDASYRLRTAIRAHELLFGDVISFHLREETKAADGRPSPQSIRHDVPVIGNIMTPHDFTFFQSMMMLPPDERDGFDQDNIQEMTAQLALKLQSKMENIGLYSISKTFNSPSYELQVGILDLYADYRADMFFRSVEHGKSRREAGPSF